MGLGKTLMMLAAVTSTLSEAEESCYFHEAHEVDPEKVHTKATLVIVSSARKCLVSMAMYVLLPDYVIAYRASRKLGDGNKEVRSDAPVNEFFY